MVVGLVPNPSVLLQGYFLVAMGYCQFWPELVLGLGWVSPLGLMQWVMLEVLYKEQFLMLVWVLVVW